MRKIAIASAMLLGVLCAPVLADLSSRYTVSSRGPDRSAYTGAIRFTANGQVYRLEEASGENKWTGLAIEFRDFLGMAEVSGDGGGFLALYKRAGDSWVGVWSGYDADEKLGAEVLYNGSAPDLPDADRRRSGELVGKYQISGTNPDGKTYSGNVEVTPQKSFFDVDRTAGNEELSGTMLAFNSAFVINVNKDTDKRAPIGVLGLFISEGNGFVGIWVQAGSQKLGAERWVRQ
jgi:hypothetical protein